MLVFVASLGSFVPSKAATEAFNLEYASVSLSHFRCAPGLCSSAGERSSHSAYGLMTVDFASAAAAAALNGRHLARSL